MSRVLSDGQPLSSAYRDPGWQPVAGHAAVERCHTQRFNRRHLRVGHLFQGRFKAIVVDRDSYLLELCRYVVLNPIRAAMVKSIEHYPWSSYPATMGLTDCPGWLYTDWLLSHFGNRRDEAQQHYANFVSEGVGLSVSVVCGERAVTTGFGSLRRENASVA